MTDLSEQVAAVLFTIDVARVAAFYEHVIGMKVRKAAPDHVWHGNLFQVFTVGEGRS